MKTMLQYLVGVLFVGISALCAAQTDSTKLTQEEAIEIAAKDDSSFTKQGLWAPLAKYDFERGDWRIEVAGQRQEILFSGLSVSSDVIITPIPCL